MDQAIYAVFEHDNYEPVVSFYEHREDAMEYLDIFTGHAHAIQVLRIPLVDPAETAKILGLTSTIANSPDTLLPYAVLTIEGTY